MLQPIILSADWPDWFRGRVLRGAGLSIGAGGGKPRPLTPKILADTHLARPVRSNCEKGETNQQCMGCDHAWHGRSPYMTLCTGDTD